MNIIGYSRWNNCPYIFNNFSSSRLGSMKCRANYSFESGEAEGLFECTDGKWLAFYVLSPPPGNQSKPSTSSSPTFSIDINLACTKTCKKDCLNGGLCTGRNKCKCSQGFQGEFCEIEICKAVAIEHGKIEERFVQCVICKVLFYYQKWTKRRAI